MIQSLYNQIGSSYFFFIIDCMTKRSTPNLEVTIDSSFIFLICKFVFIWRFFWFVAVLRHAQRYFSYMVMELLLYAAHLCLWKNFEHEMLKTSRDIENISHMLVIFSDFVNFFSLNNGIHRSKSKLLPACMKFNRTMKSKPLDRYFFKITE